MSITPRWRPATLSPMQLAYVNSTHRMNVVVAGRRSFKTEGAKRRVVREAIKFTRYSDGRFFCCAPTQQQAKDIFWEDIKALIPDDMLRATPRKSISDSELTIQLWNNAVIKVAGLDKPQRIEGKDWDGGVITEYGDCKPDVFSLHIRPMLTRGGWIDIEGVPEGRNHYYELADSVAKGEYPGAVRHHWTTEQVLHLWLGKEAAERELDEARRTLDTLSYRQEYLADFISFEGAAYYAFDDSLNVPQKGERVRYDSRYPLVFAFDFNRQPGVALILQEQPASAHSWVQKPNNRHGTLTCVIDEVFIERNSNTRKVCEQLVERWADIHTNGDVLLYGDPAGGAKTSSAVEGSDWDIIKDMLKPAFGSRVKDRVARSAPLVRTRLNTTNARLVSADGSVGTIIDPSCKRFIRDLEGVECKDTGELVKDKDSKLTHISDAFGYYVSEKFPSIGGSTNEFHTY